MPTRKQVQESAARSLRARQSRAKKEAQDAAARIPEQKEGLKIRTKLAETNQGANLARDISARERQLALQEKIVSRGTKEAEQFGRDAGTFEKPLEFGGTLKKQIEEKTGGTAKPFDIGAQIEQNVGTIGQSQSSNQAESQSRDLKQIADFNRNFEKQQEAQRKQTQVQKAQAVPEPIDLGGDIFSQAQGQQKELLQDNINGAFAVNKAQETLRENQLRQQLGNLSLGSDGENVLASLEGRMGKLSLPQLEALATQNGLELTDDLRDSLSRSGRTAIETEKITRDARFAENQYANNQLSRSFGRAITEREQFNTEQDAKMRRMIAQFGGGKFQSLGGNVAVMKSAEKGQRALEDLRGDFGDKTLLVSQRADTIALTYGNNVRIIQDQMATAQENKYTEITNTIADLMAAGVTNETDLQNSVLKVKQSYAKEYFNIAEKSFNAIERQNNELFDQHIALRGLELRESSEAFDRNIALSNLSLSRAREGRLSASAAPEVILKGTPLGDKVAEAEALGFGKKDAVKFAKKRLEEEFGKMTEAQGKAFKAVNTALAEEEVYQSVTAGIDAEEFAKSINVLTNKIKDPEAPLTGEIINRFIDDPKIRRAILSEMRWLGAVLREESGAAISLGEYITKGTAFFPRAGDDIGSLGDKERARGIETEGLLGKIGPSGSRQLRNLNESRGDSKINQLKAEHPNTIFVKDENGEIQALDSEADILPTDTKL